MEVAAWTPPASTRGRSASGSARASTPRAACSGPTPGSSCCSRGPRARPGGRRGARRRQRRAPRRRDPHPLRGRGAAALADPPAPAYVLAAEGWHPGVIGIVASRLAERHHRPVVLIALDGEQGPGSGRSIPALRPAGRARGRRGGPRAPRRAPRRGGPDHRARARRTRSATRSSPTPPRCSRRRTSCRTQRIDAVVAGRRARPRPRRGARAPRALRRRATPSRRSWSPPRCSTTRGRWARGVTSPSRSARAAPARAASPSARAPACRPSTGEPVEAAVRLEVDRWRGRRRAAARAAPRAPGPPGARSTSSASRRRSPRACRRSSTGPRPGGPSPVPRHREFGPLARGEPRTWPNSQESRPLGDFPAMSRGTASPACSRTSSHRGARCSPSTAHAPHRARALGDRVGGFAVCSWARAGGRSGAGGGLRARRRARPAGARPPPRPARRPAGRGLDPHGVGRA